MIPWTVLDTATIPDGGGELRLKQRGTEFSIMQGATELMNSRLSGSEVALATLTLQRIAERRAPHLLIGGLGMGFTLRAALAALPAEGRITVAELVPAVVAWARGPMAGLFGTCLDDPRMAIVEGDVAGVIAAGHAAFDAILLDVDNGPDGLTRTANDRLYDLSGLSASKTALTPGGILAVWSSGPDANFTRRLMRAGFAVDEVRVRANRAGRGARHTLWFAANTRPAG